MTQQRSKNFWRHPSGTNPIRVLRVSSVCYLTRAVSKILSFSIKASHVAPFFMSKIVLSERAY